MKTLELMIAQARLRRALRTLREARSLARAKEMLGDGNGVARALLDATREEWTHSADALEDREGLKERIALHLERVEAAVGRRMILGTGILATVGSTCLPCYGRDPETKSGEVSTWHWNLAKNEE